MRKIILLLLVSSGALAQPAASSWERIHQFRLIAKVEDQEKRFNELLQEGAVDKSKPNEYDEYRIALAIGWLAKGNIERYKYYTGGDPKFTAINLIDVTYALEYLVEDSRNLSIVEQVSREILDQIENAGQKDAISTGRMQVLLEVNAMANAKLGNIDVAMRNIEKSSTIKGDREISYFRDSKSDYLNRYAIVLSAAGEHKRALDTLTKAVRNADSNPRLIETLKEVYKKVHGSDKGADKYIASLQEEAYQKYYKEVEKSFIEDVNAPVSGAVKIGGDMVRVFDGKQLAKNVSLPCLTGKMVNLADFKGKILAIDFWSTGCTPCVAAFAGFERVVAEYKKEPFQLFVINLFEPQATVKSFIAKKGITLDVLRDEPNKAFDVQATPTKIIFDPMGNIRFYSIGYAGSTDREYYKLKAMVEITRARANPEGMEARMQRIRSFLTVSEASKMGAMLDSMIRVYPNENLDLEKSIVASMYAEAPDTTKIISLINTIQDPVFKVGALLQTIDIIAAFDIATALQLATDKLEGVKKIKGLTALSEPLKIDPKLTYYAYINTYGKLLFKVGKDSEAYKYTTEAYNNIKNRDEELIENYAFLSSLNGKYEDALPILAKAVKDGKNDKRYIEQVRKGYEKLNPGKDVTAYIATLQEDFLNKIKARVEKSMINETPPDFYIKDVNGNKVTLADFKGKTIVLDFWATWCGPCVESFPAMQMAVNRYKNDPDVKFLFIHTAEHVPDPLTDAKNFLARRNYDFDLYMDTVDPVLKAPPALTAFKIDGIPMKYVIDANGKIRFKISGFEGKDEEVAEEVVQMVEMARKRV